VQECKARLAEAKKLQQEAAEKTEAAAREVLRREEARRQTRKRSPGPQYDNMNWNTGDDHLLADETSDKENIPTQEQAPDPSSSAPEPIGNGNSAPTRTKKPGARQRKRRKGADFFQPQAQDKLLEEPTPAQPKKLLQDFSGVSQATEATVNEISILRTTQGSDKKVSWVDETNLDVPDDENPPDKGTKQVSQTRRRSVSILSEPDEEKSQDSDDFFTPDPTQKPKRSFKKVSILPRARKSFSFNSLASREVGKANESREDDSKLNLSGHPQRSSGGRKAPTKKRLELTQKSHDELVVKQSRSSELKKTKKQRPSLSSSKLSRAKSLPRSISIDISKTTSSQRPLSSKTPATKKRKSSVRLPSQTSGLPSSELAGKRSRRKKKTPSTSASRKSLSLTDDAYGFSF